ncbi:MAG TPA: leucyl/phenylalanyl-tRNA--protein transferase [Flavobacteriales bacterium]|jgi:leucyl/phenylalanyl-tRNA--protein transferase|nr:leucyl/phenylalanyl-tRNA--protein transferase [Flavobacteriales bacterium]HQW85794.1 leucyl/phenylalanyl-tRNA--protein transferase [Flavobacteriales bacterium]
MSRPTEVPVIPVQVLMAAYAEGRFPMAHADGELYWHDPDPRAVFDLDALRPNARLARLMRNAGFHVTRDEAFTSVVDACAERPETWIDARIRATYAQLHRAGHAHSVEVWSMDDRGALMLVGGIYGVALGGAFFGESLFHRVPNAGKVAFHALAEHLRRCGFTLFDSQYLNPFTARLGAVEVPRARFLRMLAAAKQVPACF